jgi:uncharacterized membrane protein
LTASRIWAFSGLYALLYFALGADRYLTFHSGSDLGLFTQSIASVFHGFANTTEAGSHFTFHFSPLLYLCAPFLLAVRSPLALIALGAAACALVAPPLYLLAARRLPERLALAVASVALLYPPLAGVAFGDFHENAFAPAATLWLLWAVDARRWAWAALFLAVALSIKEDQAVLLAAAALFGVVYFARRRERGGVIFSAAALVVSLATFALFFGVIRGLAGARDAWAPLHFYAWDRIVDPKGSAPWWSIGRPAYFLEAVLPLVFACFASPFFVLALPGFAECLFSHESVTYTMGTHYAAVWIPYVLAAFVFGISNIYAKRPRVASRLARASLVLCALNLVFASPTHWGHYLGLPNAHVAALERALAALPPGIEVGTHDELYAHLGLDPNASLGFARNPRFVLIDRTFAHSYWVEQMLPEVERGLGNGTYRLVSGNEGIDLYERLR